MAAHARLGPSACSRWSTCTASVGLIESLKSQRVIPERSSSVYAAEGTVAHMVRESCLRLGLDPHDFVGQVVREDGFEFTIDNEMADHLVPGIDWIRERSSNYDVEIRVDLSPWLPKQFGTMDAGWLDGDTLVASDLKYGMGLVSPERNKQQMLYALGYWHHLGFPEVDRVLVVIDQPRAGGLKFWETEFSELVEFGEQMKAVYAEIVSGNTRFAPSESACTWCEAREPRGSYTGCGAYNKWQEDMFLGAFDDLDDEPVFADPNAMSPEKRFYIVRHAKEAERWLASLHQASLDAALAGKPDPGSKAVLGRSGARVYADRIKAEGILTDAVGNDAFKPKELIGITEAEKLLKPGRKKKGHPEAWEDLQAILIQAPGKAILVPEDDERPAITSVSDMLDEFDDL